MCFFQVKFSSIQIPRKDVDSTDSKTDSLIINWPDISYFLRLLLNSTYLVLSTLIVSLFELHHATTSLIFDLQPLGQYYIYQAEKYGKDLNHQQIT